MKILSRSGEKPEVAMATTSSLHKIANLDQGLLRDVGGHPSREDLGGVRGIGACSGGAGRQLPRPGAGGLQNSSKCDCGTMHIINLFIAQL